MKTSHVRILGAAIMIASAGALALTVPPMVERLREHNRTSGVSLYKIEPALDPDFYFRDQPVRVEEVADDSGRRLLVHYRAATIPILVDGPIDDRLPGLVKYENSVRFLSIAAAGRVGDEAGFEQRPWRLIIAARHTPPGENPETWGAVQRKKWIYELVELLPEGAPAPEPLPEPSSTLTNSYGRPATIPPTSEFEAGEVWARWTFNMAALPDYERTIHYAAAIEVTPPLHRPRNVFTNTGLEAMNWTWPAAGTAILGIVVGGMVLVSTFVHRPEDEPATTMGPPVPRP